jgi:hypothetical protein
MACLISVLGFSLSLSPSDQFGRQPHPANCDISSTTFSGQQRHYPAEQQLLVMEMLAAVDSSPVIDSSSVAYDRSD